MADIQLINEGNLVGFKARTDAGSDWLRDEVHAEPWQFLGSVLYVDHRMASPLIEAAICDGLIIH
jgi:hypothetical protein